MVSGKTKKLIRYWERLSKDKTIPEVSRVAFYWMAMGADTLAVELFGKGKAKPHN